jgi:acetyl-CoA carboxylase carboxyltransferase component
MDFAALAAFLAPFLPALLKAGQSAADEAADAFGKEAWVYAQSLWHRLWPAVEHKDAAKDAAADVAKQPGSAKAQTVLEVQLEKVLAEDPELAAEVGQLFAAATVSGVVQAVAQKVIGDGNITVAGNITGSTVIAGGNDANTG